MKEWKLRREVFYRLNAGQFDDDLADKKVELTTDTVGVAIQYFNRADLGWIYPAKSYMVAICYARWLCEEFDEPFFSALNDPDLLPDDPYFVPYEADPETYDKILAHVGLDFPMTGVVPDARRYFDEEFHSIG